MAYSTTGPGIDEATRLWIQSQLIANLSLLNARLAADSATPIPPLSGNCVFYGDPQVLPSNLPLILCVYGGGRLDGMDMESQQYYIDCSSYQNTVYSSIVCYLHPDTLAGAANQVASREQLLARICDWLRAACFNTPAAITPTLTSQEYVRVPGYDYLDMAHLESITKGEMYRQFHSQLLSYAWARHVAKIGT